MGYADIERRLRAGGIVVLDGGIGTELERRGVAMDPEAWCGLASLENASVLEGIHLDYIRAGADIVTTNTYASSRLMLGPAGFADRLEEINRTAIRAARRAREASGRDDVLVAGSLSHRWPCDKQTSGLDFARVPAQAEMREAFGELARLLGEGGCDLILLEMMYYPEAVRPAFEAAMATGLPVWAGFSARRAEDGRVLGFTPDRDMAFEDLVRILEDFEVAVAGVMHTSANVTGDALAILGRAFQGPLMAYPDSGHFKSPNWHFEDVISPDELLRFATQWVESGVRIVGGCCGLSPEHIAALRPLRA